MYLNLSQAREALCSAGKILAGKNWTPATSGNFSLRFDSGILVTRSGADKGQLSHSDILSLNQDGESSDGQTPSAETDLHFQIYQMFSTANCVLHVHSLHATAISMMRDHLNLSGYELLKALPGIDTHLASIEIPVLENSQNMQDIMRQFNAVANKTSLPAYLIRGHGMYCWGNSIHETMRSVEALDFIFQCELLTQAR